jgi:hypothetical protein
VRLPDLDVSAYAWQQFAFRLSHEPAAQSCIENHHPSVLFGADTNDGGVDAVRADGLRAWAEVKKLDGPKTYQAWKQTKAPR